MSTKPTKYAELAAAFKSGELQSGEDEHGNKTGSLLRCERFDDAEIIRIVSEQVSEQRRSAQYAKEREHNAMMALAYKAELDAMRKAMSQVAANLGNGSVVSPEASVEFMTRDLPEEVRLYCQRLRGELDIAKRELTEVQARETKATVLGRIIQKERENFSEMLHAETERLFAEREKVAKLRESLQLVEDAKSGPYGWIVGNLDAARESIRKALEETK